MKQLVLVLNLKVAQVSEKLWNKKKEANPKQSWITFDTQLLCHLEASFTLLDMICPLFLSWEATRARACVLVPQCQSLVQYVVL